MMKLKDIQSAEKRLLLPTYDRVPVHFIGGHGVWLTDDTGAEYLDLLSGLGVNALGYAHPAVAKALTEHSAGLLHISNLYHHAGQAELAAKLTGLTGMDRAFFCNSGTEAWEAALKMARLYAHARRERGEHAGTEILALEHSFHGRSMGSVSTTHKAKYREPFNPLIPGVEFVRFNDVEDLRAKFSPGVCAVCVEVVQGEGGIHEVSPEFLQAARELTRDAGSLLVCDEIQSGVGRTGKFCAYQHFEIQPDVTTLAKPLGGGIPIGAMLCTEEVASAMQPGLHGTTFGGGPLATHIALTVLDTLDGDGLYAQAERVGSYFRAELQRLARAHDAVKQVRGRGLMLGMELRTAELAKAAADEMFAQRIILNRTAETVLRFLPPFLLTEKDVDLAVAALDNALAKAEETEATLTIQGDARGN